MTKGGHIQTKEAFLYGRFETLMKPAFGSGIVSSFFLFNDEKGFQNNWQEIDFEFLGRNTNTLDTNLIKTINGVTDKNIHVRHKTLEDRSEDKFWKLCIEWTPDTITWKVNEHIIRSLNIKLSKPMKLMANIWNGMAGWAGEFNDGLIPQVAMYEFIECFSYYNGVFSSKWRDSFHNLNEVRWHSPEFLLGNTNLVKENVSIKDAKLVLTLAQ